MDETSRLTVCQLVDGCGQHDPEAWAQLWKVVSDAALYPLRRQISGYGFSADLAEEMLQDFYLWLRDRPHLQSFRGETMPQFRVYLRSLAIHFAMNALRKMKRRRDSEQKARRDAPLPCRAGPTEDLVASALVELRSVMPAEALDKLSRLLDGEVSPRSRRRWKGELFDRYGHQI